MKKENMKLGREIPFYPSPYTFFRLPNSSFCGVLLPAPPYILKF